MIQFTSTLFISTLIMAFVSITMLFGSIILTENIINTNDVAAVNDYGSESVNSERLIDTNDSGQEKYYTNYYNFNQKIALASNLESARILTYNNELILDLKINSQSALLNNLNADRAPPLNT